MDYLEYLQQQLEVDLSLLKELEDTRRYERDPLLRRKFNNDITQLTEEIKRREEEINLEKQKQMNTFSKIDSVQEYRKLINLSDELLDIFTTIQKVEWINKLHRVKKTLLSNNFKIIFLGRINSGKTTLISALLGAKVLPTSVTPCTGTLTEIKWGLKPKALLHFKKPLSTNVEPPREIYLEQVEDLIVIKKPLLKKGICESSYEKLELFYPFDFIRKSGVELIDSPGFEISLIDNYLCNVDAIIYVFNSTMLGSQLETDFIKSQLNIFSSKAVIFVCNKFSYLSSEEKDFIKRYAIKTYSSFTEYESVGIFITDARDGLKGH